MIHVSPAAYDPYSNDTRRLFLKKYIEMIDGLTTNTLDNSRRCILAGSFAYDEAKEMDFSYNVKERKEKLRQAERMIRLLNSARNLKTIRIPPKKHLYETDQGTNVYLDPEKRIMHILEPGMGIEDKISTQITIE